MLAGTNDIAQLYAQNAIRKANERLSLLRLSCRIDAVASRVQTAVTMRNVTGNMTQVIKGMDKALQSMNMERISLVMEKFESQFEDLDASSEYYETVSNNTNAVSTPQEDVDLLMSRIADEAGLEVEHNLGSANTNKLELPSLKLKVNEETEDRLAEKLRALRG
ncbi:hypothetical protein BABINDRAFT_67646 [Babjeviella inositovora NRRL Y-12698]|uniref:Vacuolar protein-sorting-associated protein 46 n=1 Tax=Babjeviella inositovora NRRL Y-12698 TaxID=984486 RepID=A0A1E3QHU8_9ASCO|nr:uncharacterized protein BABINDRAFT_67646 [Babjeviella inositovora NRRL Y-12698]ODQ77178.1 hypothetical protein BABINDRAFT_67646 [Babjeviella inositovora NRRL Y-12698]